MSRMKSLVRRKEWWFVLTMVAFFALCAPNRANAGGPHVSIDLGFLFPFFGAYPVVTAPPPPPPPVVVVQPAPEAMYPPPVVVAPAPPPPEYYHYYRPYYRPYPYYSRPYRYYRY